MSTLCPEHLGHPFTKRATKWAWNPQGETEVPGEEESHIPETYPSQFPQVTHLGISAAWDGLGA